jgi:sugar phosphate permease
MNIDNCIVSRHFRRWQWIIYIIIFLCYILTTFHRITPSIMGPDLMKELKFGALGFGFMGMAYTWVYALAQVPIGSILDKTGYRMVISVLLLIGAVGAFLFSAAQNLTMLVIGRILLALGVSGFFIGGAKIISAWFSSQQYPVLWGLYMGLGAAGTVLGAAPLATVMANIGWRNAMAAIAVISILLFIMVYTLLRDHPSEKGYMSPGESFRQKDKGQLLEETVPLKAVLSMPILWLAGLLTLGINSTVASFSALWEGIYLADIFGFDKQVIGHIINYYGYGMVIGCFVSGNIVRFLKTTPTMLLGLILFLLNWLYLTFNANSIGVNELKVINFFLGSLGMVVISTTFMYAREKIVPSRLGTAMGIINGFTWIFGAGLFQQIWGFILNYISQGVQPFPIHAFQISFYLQVVMISMAVLCAFYLWKQEYQQSSAITKEI